MCYGLKVGNTPKFLYIEVELSRGKREKIYMFASLFAPAVYPKLSRSSIFNKTRIKKCKNSLCLKLSVDAVVFECLNQDYNKITF